MIRGKGYKARLKHLLINIIKSVTTFGILYNTPRKVINFRKVLRCKENWGSVLPVYPETIREEELPEIFNYKVSQRFKKYKSRNIPEAYIVVLPKGRVYGKDSNFIISSRNVISEDLSREFGVYGGKNIMQNSLLNETLWYKKNKKLTGNVAVITTSGNANFHHWNYDCIPRIHLLEQHGLVEKMDYFIITHQNQRFQTEALNRLGIPVQKIINSTGEDILIEADYLYVPSLPSVLGTVSPWVIHFLRNLYGSKSNCTRNYERIYISRKHVKARNLINNSDFLALIKQFGIIEVFPEEYSVSDFANIIKSSKFIVSVHGSGLSNGCFMSPAAVMVDILAPYHQDAYYWLIASICEGRYIGFFGDGEHPPDSLDLVKNKKDNDIRLDLEKFEQLLERELKRNR